MATDVDAVLIRRTLRGGGAYRRIEPVQEREIGQGAVLMVMVAMMIDVPIGGVGPKLHQGVRMTDFRARAEIAWQKKEAKERQAPEEACPNLSCPFAK